MLGLFKKTPEPVSDEQAVAMAEPAVIKVVDPLDEEKTIALPKGLQLRWHVGERIPWKGIWFVVVKVDEAKLELIPERMTFKMAKKIDASKMERR